MKVTTKELERCEILMTIEAEPAKERDLLKKAARRISGQVQIPGFRRGKAPYNTIVRRFGLETVQQEVLEHSSEKIVTDALEETDLEPQAPLKIDEVSWDPLTIRMRVPGPPHIELRDYRDIRLEAKEIEVTDEDVDDALKALQEQNATWAPVERPAELGDLITMSVVEKDGDEVLDENEAVEYELTAPAEDEETAKDQPDFATPLIGLSAGESKVFAIDYPEGWSAEKYAGKEITFEVEVSSVKEKELDPLDDDFAQSVSDVETLDELKAQIQSNIEQQRQFQYNKELGREVLDKIIEDAETIEWPEALEEYRIDQELERLTEQLKQSGLNLDSYFSMQNKTEEEFREETRGKIVENLKSGLVLNKVAEQELLEVNNVEILERARMIADLSGAGDQFWQSVLSSQSYQATIASDLLTDKIFQRLAAIAKGEAPEPGAEPDVVEEEVADEVESVEEISDEAESASVAPEEAAEDTAADVEISEDEA
ncbi:trigger factor [Chloroflexota bacterium]